MVKNKTSLTNVNQNIQITDADLVNDLAERSSTAEK